MKCPKCGEEIEPGSLYCGKCLQEIHWVPEYNTVETLMKKAKKSRTAENLKAQTRILKNHARRFQMPQNKDLPALKKRAAAALAVLAAVGVFLLAFFYAENSYSIQYNRAQEAYGRKQYGQALGYADKALSISPRREDAAILLAQILRDQGDLSGAAKVLEGNLRYHTDSQKYYMNLIMLYEESKAPDKIKNVILQAESEAIRKSFAYYLCPEPEISLETGTYDEELEVQIQEQEGIQYYYTLDGSQPTKHSPVYKKPIAVGEGVTELNVMGENAFGITSDVLYRKYTVLLEAPDPPEILPESGTYAIDKEITVEIPDGFRAYYAFDEYPTADSTEYIAPVKMPEGEHTFYAILVGGNDKESDVASRYYYMIGD